MENLREFAVIFEYENSSFTSPVDLAVAALKVFESIMDRNENKKLFFR